MSKLRLLMELFDIYQLEIFPASHVLLDEGRRKDPSPTRKKRDISNDILLWEQRTYPRKSITRIEPKVAINPTLLKHQMRQNPELLALQFAKLSTASEKAIVAFCDQYGLPWENRVPMGNLLSSKDTGSKDGVPLSDVKLLALYVHHLINLIVEPLQIPSQRSHYKMFSAYLFFLFIAPESIKFDCFEPNSWPVRLADDFDRFLTEIRAESFYKRQTQQEKANIPKFWLNNVSLIREYLSGLQHRRSQEGTSTPWLNDSECIKAVDMMLDILKANPHMSITLGTEQGRFFIDTLNIPDKLTPAIEHTGNSLVGYLLTSNVQSMRLAITNAQEKNTGGLRRHIVVKNLRDVIFLELYLMTIEPEMFSKCKECGHYYSRLVRKEGSKYCSTRCTNRHAKREERKRKR